jgi:GT2 family glycosyltransferase
MYINKSKKITYFTFVPKEYDASPIIKLMAARTIMSIIKQSVPLCDLIIITNAPVRGVRDLIENCLSSEKIFSESEILNDQKKISNNYLKINKSQESSIRLFAFKTYKYSTIFSEIIKYVKTDWMALVKIGTLIAPDTTYEMMHVANKKPKAILIYGDHDQVNTKGVRSNPYFKPQFSLDLFYSQNYIGHFFAFKKSIIYNFNYNEYSDQTLSYRILIHSIEQSIGVPAETQKLCDLHNNIIHLPTVLCSQTKKSINNDKQELILLRGHLNRTYNGVTVRKIKPGIYRHKWPLPLSLPFVSIIIPTKDEYKTLKLCIDSIIKKTNYHNYEIIIIDNQTTDANALLYLERLSRKIPNIKVFKYNREFNYSEMNNFAVKKSSGDILGFVNNDIEVINSDWLTEMVSHAIRCDVGCVGALLFYPDDYIQHGGVIVGMHGVADHAFRGIKRTPAGDYNGYLYSIRNPDAVTAATMLVKRSLFIKAGGFDFLDLKVAFNDVDLCLKIKSLGFRCVWTPHAELFHHESKSRNSDKFSYTTEREFHEQNTMRLRWKTHVYPRRDMLKLITL